MRHDAGTGLKLPCKRRSERHVLRGEQVQHDDRCLGDIRVQRVLEPERDQVLDLCAGGVSARLGDAHRIDVHPDAAGPELLCRSDDDTAVAASKVVHDIARSDRGQSEHPGDDVWCPGDLRRREAQQ